LKFHNRRFNNCRKDFYGTEDAIDLSKFIDSSSLLVDRTYKITFTYSNTIDKISVIEYKKKIIKHLKMVETVPDFDYSYKYADRSKIEKLLLKKENCDDIIILKNNLITDISFANLIFYDGSQYLTPATPLLKGTKREKLIEEKILREEEIYVSDLHLFKFCGIINAMLEPEDYKIDMKEIY